ncbi:MAG TPA: septum formation initiator family protein [Bacteroidota bacterium]|nr:septum formation initiator family protein [Bacteroidota bacterium]
MDNQYYRKVQPNVGSWLKKSIKNRNFLLTLLVAVPVFSFVTFSNKGIIQHLALESRKHEMQEKIMKEQEEQQRLQAQSKALENDPKAIEKVAREKYGMAREGETVYKVRKEK